MIDKAERNDGMPLMEQCLRTMSKLDEISMFMTDFKDCKDEFCKDFGILANRFSKMNAAQLAAVVAGSAGREADGLHHEATNREYVATAKTTATDVQGGNGPTTDKSMQSGFGR